MRKARVIVSLLLPIVAVLLMDGCGLRGPSVPAEEPRPPEWYTTNVPLMAAYLETLPDAAIGQTLDGILISDGRRWFEGFTYLGQPEDLPDGLRVRMLDDGTRPRAYMWLDDGSEPYSLVACSEPPFKGIRAVKLGDGPYAWKSLQPEHGVVFTPCMPPTWLPATRPSNPPPPGNE